MFTSDLEKKIKKVISWFNPDRDKLKDQNNAHQGWFIIIIVFLIINIVILSGNIYFFFKINNEEFFLTKSQVDDPTKSINQEELKKVIDSLDKKEKNFEKLLEEKPNIIDPSR